jgi:hypothetical protein
MAEKHAMSRPSHQQIVSFITELQSACSFEIFWELKSLVMFFFLYETFLLK